MAQGFFKPGSESSAQTTISSKDAVIVKCVQTSYLGKPGEPTTELAAEKSVRDKFFVERPAIKTLLQRQPLAPLTEEGDFDKDNVDTNRDGDGECFITPEMLSFWIQQKFFEDNSDTQKYNRRNIFVVDNDNARLEEILRHLNLQDGEDAKMMWINDLHAIGVYIRNEGGRIKAFIVDSEAGYCGNWNLDLIAVLRESFKNPAITLNSLEFQKDTYSCFTLTIQALRFFAKHGAEIFPYIEKIPKHYNPATRCNHLPPELLMPELLKFKQCKLDIPQSVLDTVASDKKQMTLRDYLQKYTVEVSGKSRNTAALVKKYKYYDQINSFVTAHNKLRINTDGRVSLPSQLQAIHDKFQDPDCYAVSEPKLKKLKA